MSSVNKNNQLLVFLEEVAAKVAAAMMLLSVFIGASAPTREAAYFIVDTLGGQHEAWSAGSCFGFSVAFFFIAVIFHMIDNPQARR